MTRDEMLDPLDRHAGAPAGRRARHRRARSAAAATVVLAALALGCGVETTAAGPPAVDPADEAVCAALAAPVRPTGRDLTDVDLVVYLEPGLDDAGRAAVGREVEGAPEVTSSTEVDLDATWAAFEELFADDPAILASVDPSDLPTSYELTLTEGTDPEAFGDTLTSAGVYELRVPTSLRAVDVVVLSATTDLLGRAPDRSSLLRRADWRQQLDPLVAAAPDEALAEAIATATSARPSPGEPPDPSAAEAADLVRAEALERCGLDALDALPAEVGAPEAEVVDPGTSTPGG